MLASSRTPLRRRRFVTAGVALGVLVLTVTGCSGDDDPKEPSSPTTAEPTPLGDYDTSDLTLVRGEFCDGVDPAAVGRAIDGESTESDTWSPGVRLPGSKDISNEFGCSWTSGAGTARAWVFAPPITASRAGDFADEVVGRTCQKLPAAAELGRPSIAQECGETTGIHGLVGDAWVGCEITGGAGADAVGEWCVAVLEALRT